jgi:hypothetical protein
MVLHESDCIFLLPKSKQTMQSNICFTSTPFQSTKTKPSTELKFFSFEIGNERFYITPTAFTCSKIKTGKLTVKFYISFSGIANRQLPIPDFLYSDKFYLRHNLTSAEEFSDSISGIKQKVDSKQNIIYSRFLRVGIEFGTEKFLRNNLSEKIQKNGESVL